MGQLTRNALISIGLLSAVPNPGVAADEFDSPIVGFCCASDEHGYEMQSTGLGQSHPTSPDLSSDPAWRVYGFKRDGIEYFQVNDLAGRVLFVIGSAGGSYWTLPAGEVPDNVILVPQRQSSPKAGARSLVYASREFSLLRFWDGERALWIVETLGTPP